MMMRIRENVYMSRMPTFDCYLAYKARGVSLKYDPLFTYGCKQF